MKDHTNSTSRRAAATAVAPAGDARNVEMKRDDGMPDLTKARGLVVLEDCSAEPDGFRAPGFGAVQVPDDWGFLLDDYGIVVREVKEGPHWTLGNRYGGKIDVLYAPIAAIEAARANTRAEHERGSGQSCRYGRIEERCRRQFKEACVKTLGFAPEHSQFAEHIADAATEWAYELGEAFAGQTPPPDLDRKALMAVRTRIRHTLVDINDYCSSALVISEEEWLYEHCPDWDDDDHRDDPERPTASSCSRSPLFQEHEDKVDRILAKFRDRSGYSGPGNGGEVR